MQLHIHEGAVQNAIAIYLSLYGNPEFPIATIPKIASDIVLVS